MIGSVTRLLTVPIEVTNLCVVQIHSLTALMEYVLNGKSVATGTMTAETIVMKKVVQV